MTPQGNSTKQVGNRALYGAPFFVPTWPHAAAVNARPVAVSLGDTQTPAMLGAGRGAADAQGSARKGAAWRRIGHARSYTDGAQVPERFSGDLRACAAPGKVTVARTDSDREIAGGAAETRDLRRAPEAMPRACAQGAETEHAFGR